MGITLYHDFQNFYTATGILHRVDFENFPIKQTVSIYHLIKLYLIPNPFILDGITFTSSCCLFTTYNAYKDESPLFISPNGTIYFSPKTNGVMLKLENVPNFTIKIVDGNSNTLTITPQEKGYPVFLGFISSNGIDRINFIDSNIFLSSIFLHHLFINKSLFKDYSKIIAREMYKTLK